MTKNTTVNTSGFIMLPRELLSAKFTTLSLHARVLYSLLLDRNELLENFSNAKLGLFTGLLRCFVACVLCIENNSPLLNNTL